MSRPTPEPEQPRTVDPTDLVAIAHAVLRCPSCRAPLRLEPGRWGCTACPRAGKLDDQGIVHLTDEDFYYREVPREFFAELSRATGSIREMYEAFERALAGVGKGKRSHVVRYAIDPNRGGAALLAGLGAGKVALDFGSGWGVLTRAIAHLGATVFSVDMTYESLLYSRKISRSRGEVYVKAGRQYPLPFADASFDVVFLNGVLEWVAEGFMLDKDPGEVQRMFLAEFRRVLKPGGQIVIGIENRNSHFYWRGQKEDHTGLVYGALLPRPMADAYSRLVRRRPYRTYTHTKRGYTELVTRAGFAAPHYFVPSPRYRYYNEILDEEVANERRARALGERRRRGGVKGGLDSALERVGRLAAESGLYSWFVADFYFVADRDGEATAPGSTLLDRIAAAEGDRLDRRFALRTSSTHTFNFETEAGFYKVPITPEAEARLVREIRALETLAGTAVARHLVGRARLGRLDGVAYGVFERRDAEPIVAPELAVRFAESALAELEPAPTMGPLGGAKILERLSRGTVGDFVDRRLARTSLARIVEALGPKRAPLGRVHGDFCQQNLIQTRHGEWRIVDWDRLEANSPPMLDVLHFWIDGLRKQERLSWAAALDRALRAWREAGPLPFDRRLLDRLSGEVSPAAWLTLYVLDRVEKDLGAVPHPVCFETAWHEASAAALAFVEPEWLASSGVR